MVSEYPDVPSNIRGARILKAYRYNGLAWNNNRSNTELALKYIDTSETLFAELDYDEGHWQNVYGLGTIFRHKGDQPKALEYYDQYYQHYLDPFDSMFVSNVQFQRGVIFQMMGDYDNSANCFMEASNLDRGLGRLGSAANNLNSLANTYKKAKLIPEALEAYEEGLELIKDDRAAYTHAIILINQANTFAEIDSYDLSIGTFRKAMEIAAPYENLTGSCYENLGAAFLKINEMDSALYYLQEAYNIKKDYVESRELVSLHHKLGRVNLNLNKLDVAEYFLNKSLVAARTKNELKSITETLLDLSKLEERKGNFAKALSYKNEFISAKDSLLDQTAISSVAEMEAKYQTTKKEAEIERLALEDQLKQNRLTQQRWAIGGLTMVLALLGFLFYRLHKQKQIIEQQNEENKSLLKEIHHRVKNNLQVISSLLKLQSRSVDDEITQKVLLEGQDRVRSMSLIHQNLYQDGNLKGIQMKDYLSQLANEIVENYQHTDQPIELEMQIDEIQLDVDSVVPIGLIVNELITNSIKYAFDGVELPQINLEFRLEGDHLKLRYQDNGPGFNRSEISTGSTGMRLIRSFSNRLQADMIWDTDGHTKLEMLIKDFDTVS